MARPIVVGSTTAGPGGLQVVNFWGRVAIALPARQAYYAGIQAGLAPAAPGAYGTLDAQEIPDYRAGLFVEVQAFDVIDPTLTIAQLEARLQRLASAIVTNRGNTDASLLQYYGSFFDGTSWTGKSA